MQRRDFLRAFAVAGAAALVPPRLVRAAETADAASLVAGTLSCDFHSHAWRRAGELGAEMREGGMSIAVMAAVADRPLIKREGGRLRALGSPARGHLHYQAMRQVADIKRRIETEGLATILAASDAEAAHAAGRPGVVIGFEGGDALEGEIERVAEFHAEGVRWLQLVHFRVNELGDIQTEDPVHDGLTPFGASVVRECNRLGMVVDLAHATFDVVRQALPVATRPPVLSHTFLTDKPRRHTRGITRQHARAIAEAGGVIGVVPFPFSFPTMHDYAEGFARMADAVGVEHVGIGSDLDGIPTGTPPLNFYRQYPQLVQALAERGFAREDLQKIMGGNFLRVFGAATAAA